MDFAVQPASPEHGRLNMLAGRWNAEGMTNDGRTVPVRAVDSYEWLPGGYAMLHRTDAHIGDDHYESVEIIGYDAAQTAFVSHFFDSWGQRGGYTMTADGNTWAVAGETERAKLVVREDGQTITAHWEMSQNGVDWHPWMEMTLTRA